jgi:hypothetical protein
MSTEHGADIAAGAQNNVLYTSTFCRILTYGTL